jgi:predicted permease
LIGYLFGKIRKINLTAINDFVIYISTPCLILHSLGKEPIEIFLAGKVFLSVLLIIGASLVIGYFIIKAFNLPLKVYLPPILFANTGNMGLPLVLFAFGDTGFNVAILYMVSVTIIHYTLGIMILSFDESPFELFKLPLIYSAALGIILGVSGWSMPTLVDRAIHLLGDASIPTMIFALGYKLSEITISEVKRSFAFGGLRIGLGFALGMAAVKILHLDGTASNAVTLQSAMPPAIFNFVLAEKYKQDSQIVASIIMAGTLISVLTTPIIIAYLIR